MSLVARTRLRWDIVQRDLRFRLGGRGGAPARRWSRWMLAWWRGHNAAPRVTRDAIAFQSDLEEVIAELPPPMIRGTNHAIAGLLVVTLVLASVLHVDIVVQGSGHLAADSPTIVLQPIERAIIRTLAVKPGDLVVKGQVLATLDPTFNAADLESLQAQQKTLLARMHRLEAELRGVAFDAASAGNSEDALQATLYQERQTQYAARLHGFAETIQGLESDIKASQNNAAVLSRQLLIARDVEGMRAELLRVRAGSRLQYLDAQSQTMQTEKEYQAAIDRLGELHHEVEAKRAELQGFITQWRGEGIEALARDRGELAKMQDELTKVTRLHDLVVVSAPEDGVVLDVAMRSAGSVLREAEPLITLLPSNAALMAEVVIRSSEIGYVRPGDAVAVKVDAFPFQRHGQLEGRLRSIAEQSFGSDSTDSRNAMAGGTIGSGQGGGGFHRVQVALTKTDLRLLPEGTRLIPGMSVSAEMKAGSRSVLAYFLAPITRGLDESIREP